MARHICGPHIIFEQGLGSDTERHPPARQSCRDSPHEFVEFIHKQCEKRHGCVEHIEG
jgi:hypothetical protein